MAPTQALLNLFACRRRNISCTSPASEQGPKKLAASSDSESTDASNAEFSDRSEFNSTPGSHDDSDNEVDLRVFNLAVPPPGFAQMTLPPGLDAPPGLVMDPKSQAQSRTRLTTRLNSQAPLFVPGCGTVQTSAAVPAGVCEPPTARQTISLCKGVLQEWEANVNAEEAYLQQQQSVDKPAVYALQEAISRLSHGEAATLRSFLQTKETSPSMSFANGLPTQAPQSVGTHMGINAMSADAAAACPFQFLNASYPPPVAGVQYPGAFGSAGVQMTPPPGAFCYNQPATSVPGPWMNPAATLSPPQPYTPLPSKPRGSTRAPSNAVAEDSSPATADETKETLRTNLRDLSLAEPTHVLMVRKINRLGLDSPGALEAYFSKFGAVERVMVSHSRAKSMFGRGAARVRPAGLGFLIMANAEGVEAALAAGLEHEIQGNSITVSRFEGRSVDTAEVEAQ